MKSKKVVVSALALLVGVGLAGSVSGTIAWYQYSTRAHAAIFGTSAGTSGNLMLRIKNNGNFVTRLTKQDVQTWLAAQDDDNGQNVQPITSGDMDKDDALPANFYRNPIAGVEDQAKWLKADKSNYITLPLQLKFVENDGSGVHNIEEKVYISDLLIQKDKSADKDLSDAVRVHISTSEGNWLVSKKGETIATEGELDLDGDGQPDQKYVSDLYGFEDDTLEPITYGAGEQESFNNVAGDANSIIVEKDDESLELLNVTDKEIGKTLTATDSFFEVTLTIWVEGWQEFGAAGNESAIWDAEFIDQMFNVGIEFATQAK